MKKCVVTGHRGMLGSYLMDYIPGAPGGDGFELTGLDYPEIDITDGDRVAALFADPPDILINCAAWTDVDGAESHEREAFSVNAVGPELLAHAARRSGSLLVHISTDFVFDGGKQTAYTESDQPAPRSVYGKSKLAGELAVAAIAPEHLIIRTAWLYGPNGRHFIDTILRISRETGELKVVTDQHGSPTFTGMLSRVLWRLATTGARGVFHVAGAGTCTWFDLARRAVALAGVEARIAPVSTEEFPRPAPRPKNSALDCSKAEAHLGEKLPPWPDGLQEYIKGS